MFSYLESKLALFQSKILDLKKKLPVVSKNFKEGFRAAASSKQGASDQQINLEASEKKFNGYRQHCKMRKSLYLIM